MLASAFYNDNQNNTVIDNINTLCERYNKPCFITEIGCMPWEDGYIDVLCTYQYRNWYVPAKLAESAMKYLCNNKNIIGFSWWHTDDPFNYFNDTEVLPLEQVFIDYVKGGKI